MANSVDPDQVASSEANWSGSTLFAKAGYPIRLLFPDCGYKFTYIMAYSVDPDQLASSEAN